MKPTTRISTQRRLEALEGAQAATQRTPELRLILDKGDGTREVHILGKVGKFIVPAKMEPEEWTQFAATCEHAPRDPQSGTAT